MNTSTGYYPTHFTLLSNEIGYFTKISPRLLENKLVSKASCMLRPLCTERLSCPSSSINDYDLLTVGHQML